MLGWGVTLSQKLCKKMNIVPNLVALGLGCLGSNELSTNVLLHLSMQSAMVVQEPTDSLGTKNDILNLRLITYVLQH